MVTGATSAAKAPPSIGRQRVGERAQRVVILLVAGELERLGAILGEGAHQATLVVGVLEPVEKHVIVGLLVTNPCAAAHGGQQVGGRSSMLSMPPATITSA